MVKFAEYPTGELQALWSCTLWTLFTVSRARKPRAGVLSISGIRNDDIPVRLATYENDANLPCMEGIGANGLAA